MPLSAASFKPANPTLVNGGSFVILRPAMNLFVNQRVNYVLSELGQIAFLTRDVFLSLLTFKVTWRDLLYQIYTIGVKSQSVVLVTGAFTGMVLGAQTYFQFHKVKMDTATLAVVSVSLCDELGPVLTALMVAGRVGASIAAEIGTMRVTDQIDALTTLSTNPMKYLVAPRLLAATIALPLLVLVADVLGVMGGFIVSTLKLGFNKEAYLTNTVNFVQSEDVISGLVKAGVFGFLIALMGCYQGYNSKGGAQGVGGLGVGELGAPRTNVETVHHGVAERRHPGRDDVQA